MSFDIHKKVIDEEHDEEAIEEYTEELFALFVESPEAKVLDDEEEDFDGFHWAHVLIGFGIDYCDVAPAQMSGAQTDWSWAQRRCAKRRSYRGPASTSSRRRAPRW